MYNKIICVGGVTIDRKITPIQSLCMHTSNPVSSVFTFGGVAYNVAKNLVQLTNNIEIQSVIGEDSDGINIKKNLNSLGIHSENLLKISGKNTAHYDVVLNMSGEVFIALADMNIFEHIPLKEFTCPWQNWKPSDLIFLDTNLPATLINEAIQLSHLKNLILCLDPVSVAKAQKLPYNLHGVFLLKPDRLEAEILTQRRLYSIEDCIAAGDSLLERGVKNCVITLGEEGYVVVNRDVRKHFPAVPVETIKDVSGAGDAFIAGILYQLKQGFTLIEACETGAAAAALTLQSFHSAESLSLIKLKRILLQTQEVSHEPVY